MISGKYAVYLIRVRSDRPLEFNILNFQCGHFISCICFVFSFSLRYHRSYHHLRLKIYAIFLKSTQIYIFHSDFCTSSYRIKWMKQLLIKIWHILFNCFHIQLDIDFLFHSIQCIWIRDVSMIVTLSIYSLT